MWGYLSMLAAMAEGVDQTVWLERQRKMSLESADLWKFEGVADERALRDAVKAALDAAWQSIIIPPTSGARRQ